MTQVLGVDSVREDTRVAGDLPMRPARWWLWTSVAAGVGLALRLYDTLVVRANFTAYSDSTYYYGQGKYLAEGMGYINPLQLGYFGRVVESAYHPPLYGTFLGLV